MPSQQDEQFCSLEKGANAGQPRDHPMFKDVVPKDVRVLKFDAPAIFHPTSHVKFIVISQAFRKPWGSLSNLDASVCVGQCNNDWGHMGFSGTTESSEKIGAYTGLAATCWRFGDFFEKTSKVESCEAPPNKSW